MHKAIVAPRDTTGTPKINRPEIGAQGWGIRRSTRGAVESSSGFNRCPLSLPG